MGELIADLRNHSTLPWLVGGDFNEIFYHSEKKGGCPKNQNLLDSFRNFFLDCNLFDLGYSGYDFTWCNFRHSRATIEERLDRFCASTEWSLLYPNASVLHIDSDILDHLLSW